MPYWAKNSSFLWLENQAEEFEEWLYSKTAITTTIVCASAALMYADYGSFSIRVFFMHFDWEGCSDYWEYYEDY